MTGEYFENLFSNWHLMDESPMEKIPRQEVKLDLDCSLTQEEIRKAIAKLKMHKAPGINGILAEFHQQG